MKTPVAYCKVLKTQKWTKVNLADIQEVNSNNRLCPFDEATYKKGNKYVIKDNSSNKYLVICVVEFADSDTELDSKLFDDDGNRKRFAISKRLSLGPTELEASDLEGCEINASKLERAMVNGMRKKKDAEESDNILQVMSTKNIMKRKDGKLKRKSDLNVGETKKATVEDNRKILKLASKVSPKKRSMSVKEHLSPKKKKIKADASQREAQQGNTDEEEERQLKSQEEKQQQTEEEKQQKIQEEKQRKTEEENQRKTEEEKQRKIQEEKQRKIQEEKQRKTEEEKQRKIQEEKQRKIQEEQQRKIQEEKQRKTEDEKQRKTEEKKQQKTQEDCIKDSTQDFTGEDFHSCGNAVCASQLSMALLALQKSDERCAALLENFNGLKKELREIKDAISSGTPQVKSKKETCKLRNLRDVNPETDLEYTIPDGMVHIGGGKCISLVHVAKLEKLDDLRGRLAGLCRLYWPGKELNEWSLSGKKGKNTVNKITNDYSAGMAEILRCMHWRKKANLEHSNVHRTLSRVISELHNKKGTKKSYWQKSPVKEKMRDMEGQSDEDVDKDEEDMEGQSDEDVDKDEEDNSNEQLNDKKSSTGSEKMRDMEEESGEDEDTDEEENSKELLNNKKRSSGSEASDSDSE